jgi:hypothetical protein
MTPHADQLRRRFLLAMGLGSLSLSLLQGCDTPQDGAFDAPAPPVDGDGDGFATDLDCDDASAAVSPDAEEVCDGIDNNCDGVTDTDAVDRLVWYADGDGDGHGDAGDTVRACEAPAGMVAEAGDCDPERSDTHPGAEEQLGDRLDNDCDGMADEMRCPEAAMPASVRDVQKSRGETPLMFCVERPEDGSVCVSPDDIQGESLVEQAVGAYPSHTDERGYKTTGSWSVTDAVCGPDGTVAEQCCYVFEVDAQVQSSWDVGVFKSGGFEGLDEAEIGSIGRDEPVHGRPLTVEGVARIATPSSAAEWAGSFTSDVDGLSVEQRRQLADTWHQAGLYEHASVASFARFAMELMALGAPPELVMAATRAQADEIAHALDCFSVASGFAGSPRGPGPIDIGGAMGAEVTAERLLVQTILDACINETLAAAEALCLSERAEDDAIRRTLEGIAEDESEHAALGWRTVRWLLDEHPELSGLAQETFAAAAASLPSEADLSGEDAWMMAHGCMPDASRVALSRDVWRQVIAPCAQALVGAAAA